MSNWDSYIISELKKQQSMYRSHSYAYHNYYKGPVLWKKAAFFNKNKGNAIFESLV